MTVLLLGPFSVLPFSITSAKSPSTLLYRHVYLPCDEAMAHDERICCRVPLFLIGTDPGEILFRLAGRNDSKIMHKA